ncbi:MAG: exonuclease SbcCD subunit D C-terminal domain-containing protein, partial [Deltaproteobacteria bacterium]
PLTKGRRLVELRGKLDAVLARAPDYPDAHIRVVLDVAQPEPGLAQRVREQLPGVVDVRLDYPEQVEPETTGLAALPPDEQFARYYLAQHSAPPAPELIALFRELYDQTVETDASALGGI